METSELPTKEVKQLSSAQKANLMLDDEKAKLSDLGMQDLVPRVEIREDSPTPEVISKLLTHNREFFEIAEKAYHDFENKIDGYGAIIRKFSDKVDALLLQNQTKINELEPIALQEIYGTDHPIAKIVRFGSPGMRYWSRAKGDIYEDGTPVLIAVANTEKGSAYQQLATIIKSVAEPLIEVDKKTTGIKTIVLYGSVVSELKRPGDIDVLVLTNYTSKNGGYRNPWRDGPEFIEGVSKTASDFYAKLVEIDWTQGGEGDISFHLTGDTITKDHTLQIYVMRETEYLRQYNAVGSQKEQILKVQMDMAEPDNTERALRYKNLGLSHAQMAANGGQIVYGDNIKDDKENEVFRHHDDDLLK